MKFKKILTLTLIASALIGCGSSNNKTTTVTPTTVSGSTETTETATNDNSANDLGISAVPDSLSSTFTAALLFDRYTKVDTPNGGAIHIVAQDGISNNQIVRARGILQHFLTDYPGSVYGADKSAVANKMAENNAILMLLNGVDDGTNGATELEAQPLYYGEMQVEGHDWYVNQNYEHRDASYEEILHLVHDYGIGVDQNPQFIGAMPDFQAEIRAAQVAAETGKLWAWSAENADWLKEITAENSLTQEYLASVIDTYYGLWGASDSQYGMWGAYIAKVRGDLATKDPLGADLMDNKFFHPYLTYNARIDESFSGDFSLTFESSKPYTHHSQYLKDVTLTGSNSSNIVVNQLDNQITGNSADNIVIFSGPSSEYEISNNNGEITVKDMSDNRDGTNTLVNIEKLQFSETTIETSSI